MLPTPTRAWRLVIFFPQIQQSLYEIRVAGEAGPTQECRICSRSRSVRKLGAC